VGYLRYLQINIISRNFQDIFVAHTIAPRSFPLIAIFPRFACILSAWINRSATDLANTRSICFPRQPRAIHFGDTSIATKPALRFGWPQRTAARR
jgi:hypothetical protein